MNQYRSRSYVSSTLSLHLHSVKTIYDMVREGICSSENKYSNLEAGIPRKLSRFRSKKRQSASLDEINLNLQQWTLTLMLTDGSKRRSLLTVVTNELETWSLISFLFVSNVSKLKAPFFSRCFSGPVLRSHQHWKPAAALSGSF